MPRTQIRTEDISVGAVNAQEIGANAVDVSEIAANAVETAKINDNAVTAAKLADGTYLANRNRIINGNFDVWQRGTSFAGVTATGYQADRWEVQPATGCTMTISRQAFTAGQTDVPYEPTYFLRTDITTAGSANSEISQKIEDVRTFAGQTVIASFYAKSTAGTPTLNCRFHQDFGSGGSTRVTTGVTTKVLSSSWQKFTFTLALGSISGKTIGGSSYLAFNFYWANNSTSNDVDLAQVQVEAGSVATPFEFKSFGQEIAACQRYFNKTFAYATAPANGAGHTWVGALGWDTRITTQSANVNWQYPVAMRTAPTGTLYNTRTGGAAGQWTTGGSDSANARFLTTSETTCFIDNTGTTLGAASWGIWAAADAEI